MQRFFRCAKWIALMLLLVGQWATPFIWGILDPHPIGGSVYGTAIGNVPTIEYGMTVANIWMVINVLLFPYILVMPLLYAIEKVLGILREGGGTDAKLL